MFDVMDVCCVDPFFKTMPGASRDTRARAPTPAAAPALLALLPTRAAALCCVGCRFALR
jgi:hypothetical protein